MDYRRHIHTWSPVALMLSFVLAVGAVVAAQGHQTNATLLTFSAPVRVPGVTLPAGTYSFERIDSNLDHRMVQIFKAKPRRLVATLVTVPVTRDGRDGEVVLASSAGTVPLLRVWYERGTENGFAFVYAERELDTLLHPPVVLSTK